MTTPISLPATPDRPLDKELNARVLLGDQRAARALYEAHVGAEYRIAFQLSGDAEVANDVTQDSFIRAFRQLSSFRGESAFGTWLHRVAVRTTINGLRKVRRLRKSEADLTSWTTRPSSPALDLYRMLELERVRHRQRNVPLHRRLPDAVDTLPEAQRHTLVLHDLEGYTHPEIGRALGVAEFTAKPRLSQARSSLRKQLADLAPREGEYAESRHGPERNHKTGT